MREECQGYEELGFAKVDHQRASRCGWPEVIYSAGKTAEQITQIMRSLLEKHPDRNIFATRCDQEKSRYVKERIEGAYYDETARILYVRRQDQKKGCVAVFTAGTSDLPVAEEAVLTAELMGAHVERSYDVGVAGIHRLLAQQPLLDRALAVIVVAGMEGALGSVIGGLTKAPIVAVPTSVGYGANFQGLTALLSMMNSCATGMSVVNIDNGFGAGYLAAVINDQSVSCLSDPTSMRYNK